MSGRVVVVTGASGGIGKAAAIACAARGDRLVLAARDRARLESVATSLGTETLVVPADVARDADMAALADAAVERFGRIDVWVHSAAVMAYGRFEDLPAEVFDRVVTTDLLGAANAARAALRVFRQQSRGTLILCGSLVGHIAVPNMAAYTTSKWGLRVLARTLRLETRDAPDIQVCTLTPGSVDTAVYRSAANYAGFVGRPPPPVDTAERVAAGVLRLIDRPRGELSIGLTNRFIEFGFVALPPIYDALVGPLMGRLGLSRERIDPHPGNVFVPVDPVEGGPGRWGRGALLAVLAGSAALAAGSTAVRRRAVRH
ncbi:SDR family NAD(P)-dependent oxidoreductase [Actinoplanes sp. NEAU-A12]|uniref:SDR family NAD(P)-dependent oxidoreductase n=1 Tax=Actinoplanes sandaracinus TaxID=3045177 RepID=A0ABT6WU11_9ACTN|nr:SDR family NAD(P)-dependent oxidoreductase [Actinoplanes sandaracinus]MDI6103241.1 SDR family NAD(P)-dependent oxidoreductase [Actinoplanes sandaracinus]